MTAEELVAVTEVLPGRRMEPWEGHTKHSRKRCVCHGPASHVGKLEGRIMVTGCSHCVRSWTRGRGVLS